MGREASVHSGSSNRAQGPAASQVNRHSAWSRQMNNPSRKEYLPPEGPPTEIDRQTDHPITRVLNKIYSIPSNTYSPPCQEPAFTPAIPGRRVPLCSHRPPQRSNSSRPTLRRRQVRHFRKPTTQPPAPDRPSPHGPKTRGVNPAPPLVWDQIPHQPL